MATPIEPTVVMREGSVMQLLTGDRSGSSGRDDGATPVLRSVLVWWEPGATPTKLGSILYSDVLDPSAKKKVDGQELPMSRISDVFLGKQHAGFQSECGELLPSSLCFTLGSKSVGQTLNLVAPSAEVRAAWIQGIKAAWVAKDAAKAAATAGAALAVAAFASPASPTPADGPSLPLMTAGQSFLSLIDASSAPLGVFVWHDPSAGKLGTLYQSDRSAKGLPPQQRERDERTALPLHLVTDVHLGKQHALFSSPYAVCYPSTQCFSLVPRVGARSAMHLVAPTQAVRDAWIGAIKAAFTHSPGKKTLDAPPSHATNPAGSGASVAPSSPPPPSGPSPLLEGRVFRSVVLDASAPGGARASDIFLWHDPSESKLGTLHWSPVPEGATTGEKTKGAGQSMAVRLIRDVMLGKQTAELRSEFAKDVPGLHAFSLLTNKAKGEGLHLIAANEAERNAIMAAIKGLWTTAPSGAGARPQQANAQTAPASGVGAAVSPSASSISSSAFPPTPLAQGRIFRSVLLDPSVPGGAASTDIVLRHVAGGGPRGALHWSSASGAPDQSMPVHMIRDVAEGKQTAELRSALVSDVPDRLAFSVLTDKAKGEGLHLITDNDDEQSEALAAFRAIISSPPRASSSGNSNRDSNNADSSIADSIAASAAPASAVPSSSQPTLSACPRCLAAAEDVTATICMRCGTPYSTNPQA